MDRSQEAELIEESAKLTEGLKSCRAVIDNYRNMMVSASLNPDAETHSDALNDNAD